MRKLAAIALFAGGMSLGVQAQVTTTTGVTIPRDKMLVFLFMGNSNMNGVDAKRDTIPMDRTWCWRLNGQEPPSKYVQGTWAPAISPIYFYGDNGGWHGGMAVPILRTLAQAFPGYHFGGCEVSQYSVNPRFFWQGSANYRAIIDNAMKQFAGKVTFAGLIYEQNFELDEDDPGYQVSWYAEDMKKLIAQVRTDLNAPDLKTVFGEACWQGAGVNDPINLQIRSVVSWDPGKVASVSASGITHYNFSHYNYDGYYTFAGRVRDIFQSKGWISGSTARANPGTRERAVPRAAGRDNGLWIETSRAGAPVVVTDVRGSVLHRSVLAGRGGRVNWPGLRGVAVVSIGTEPATAVVVR